jgi:hypothetical protein
LWESYETHTLWTKCRHWLLLKQVVHIVTTGV